MSVTTQNSNLETILYTLICNNKNNKTADGIVFQGPILQLMFECYWKTALETALETIALKIMEDENKPQPRSIFPPPPATTVAPPNFSYQ